MRYNLLDERELFVFISYVFITVGRRQNLSKNLTSNYRKYSRPCWKCTVLFISCSNLPGQIGRGLTGLVFEINELGSVNSRLTRSK